MKNKEVICGIYMIRNNINNKVYIGRSINIKKRWNEHKKDLRNNNHHSKKLQKSWNKYGAECFSFLVLEKTKKENIIEEEQKYLDLYKPFGRNGFNNSKSSTGPIGVKRNDLKKYNEKFKSYPIHQYSDEYELINSWKSIRNAAKSLNTCPSNIARACNGKTKSCGGFIWVYQNDLIKIIQKESIKKRKIVFQFDLDNNFIKEWKSASDAGRNLNISISHISSVCNGKRISTGGYKWRYKK